MSTLASVLKAEILRLSKKTARQATVKLRKRNAMLRRSVADLKRRCTAMEKRLGQLAKAMSKPEQTLARAPEVSDKELAKARPTAKMVRGLRQKFGLSQRAFGGLLGVTGHSVHLWEQKKGRLQLRGEGKRALLGIRKMGKRQVKAALSMAQD